MTNPKPNLCGTPKTLTETLMNILYAAKPEATWDDLNVARNRMRDFLSQRFNCAMMLPDTTPAEVAKLKKLFQEIVEDKRDGRQD